MAANWENLPNASLIKEVLENIKKNTVHIKFPQWGDTSKESYQAAKARIKELDRLDDWRAVVEILLANTDNFMVSSAIEACTALIAWDDISNLFTSSVDQLQLSLQMLPESDRFHHAVELILPIRQLIEVVLTKEDTPT